MPAKISFASFNLYNFQKTGLTTYGNKPVSKKEYERKRNWTRDMLSELDADVVVFQELWHKDCLDDVLSAPEFSDYHPIYIKESWYNIAVAMIVRKPWIVSGSKKIIKKFPFKELLKVDENDGEDDEVKVSINKFSRSVIKLRIKHKTSTTTPKITVFACHLKSKLPSSPSKITKKYRPTVGSAISTIRRTAEATALRMTLIDHMKGGGTPTVVIGDLNDDPLSNTVNLLTDQPTMTKRSSGGDKSLYNTLFLQQLKSFRDVYFTHEFKNHKGVLDHILVSEEFFEHSSDALWAHKNTSIWNDHIGDNKTHTTDHGIIKSSFV